MNDDAVPLYSQEGGFQKSDIEDSGMVMAPTKAADEALNAPLPMLIGPDKVVTTCPHCRCSVKTTIKHRVTTRTHMLAIMCCFICCCCCLPYCMDSARNTDHYCPNCSKYLGTYNK